MRPVREPVEQGGRETFVAEDLGPVGETQIGGDDQRDLLIESAEQNWKMSWAPVGVKGMNPSSSRTTN